MSPTNPLEKCNQFIGKIRLHGFLYFFLTNFTTSNFDLSSISNAEISELNGTPDEEFFIDFSVNFAVPICLKTVQNYISITRDEYKMRGLLIKIIKSFILNLDTCAGKVL